MATTMHFGPEWMRPKQQTASRAQPPPSPPPTINPQAPPNASTYSALVSPAPPPEPEECDETHPFRYSKEEMLRIYKEGGGKGGLGLEVERWEGVVREVGSEPIGLREMNDAEKKLFAGPLNSDIRRRQSTDLLSPMSVQPSGGDRSRFNHSNTGSGSPMREKFGSYMGKRRESADPPPLAMPRKQSLSSGQSPLASPRDNTPRTRIGFVPSFDGVLSAGDSWLARRKAADGLSKSTSGSRGDSVDEVDSKTTEIKEEEISDIATTPHSEGKPESNQRSTPQQSDPSSVVGEASEELASQTANMNINGVPSESDDQNIRNVLAGKEAASALILDHTLSTPSQSDLANVEWSYLDPQGNVQGPFLAHIMQNWYEVGYFTPDLLMRRTHIDNEWVPVGELARRAGSGKLFLSLPIVSTAPPGLSRQTEPSQPFTSAQQDQNAFSAPYQPVPTRSLRTSTLDSYLTSSNPSDSPSSSFGAGRFSNDSPDPATFGGRAGGNLYAGEAAIGGRIPNYSASPRLVHQQGRGTFNEPPLESTFDIHSGAFGNVAPGRASSVDNYGFNGVYHNNQTPWPSNVTNTGQGFDSMATGRNSAPMTAFTSTFDSSRLTFRASATANQSGGFNRDSHDVTFGDNSAGHTSFSLNGFNTPGTALVNQQQLTQYPGNDSLSSHTSIAFNDTASGLSCAPFGGQSQQYSQTPLPYGNAPQHTALSIQTNIIQNSTQTTNALHQSPWDNLEPIPLKRPGPFDASHPKATNTVVKQSVTPSQPLPWARSSSPQSVSQANESSPWYAASQKTVSDESWRDKPGPNSLTFDNVGAHNQQHEAPASEAPMRAPETPAESQLPSSIQPSPIPAETISPSVPEPLVIAPPAAPKSKRKSATQKIQPVARNPSPPPVPAPSKPAWSTEDDNNKKVKSPSIGLGLREIQEAEAKRMEVRKASERERERAARVTSSATTPSSDDLQSFTASWGLPSSRAGARSDILPKESPVMNTASPLTPNTPVWTNTGKPQPVKKTMKEILEEEERRKKLGAKEAAATAAARRGYAGGTSKIAPATQTGGAWTTVGAPGKAPPTTPSTARSSIVQSTSNFSGSSSSVWTNGPTASRPAGAPASTPKVDIPPTTPSDEFLKWLGNSLKGLNNTVNFEDITSMLLSFPVDPDSSTVEIISDLIYANSTTLDGRRFASEFVSKRKADVASRRGTAAAGKSVSIADIVKTQPKPMQPEWGGFKVVNKKKKGGRS